MAMAMFRAPTSTYITVSMVPIAMAGRFFTCILGQQTQEAYALLFEIREKKASPAPAPCTTYKLYSPVQNKTKIVR